MTPKAQVVETFKEMHFDAGHYLSHLAPCDHLHGHTYVLKNLELAGRLEGDILVDFNAIKSLVKEYDHSLLVPKVDESYWKGLVSSGPLPFKLDKVVMIEGEPTVERLGLEMARKILSTHANIERVTFTIFEGVNQGVKVDVSK
jgi:6-pyruvoyl-tetrahydropterin synthase